jgi:hypothetical protein
MVKGEESVSVPALPVEELLLPSSRGEVDTDAALTLSLEVDALTSPVATPLDNAVERGMSEVLASVLPSRDARKSSTSISA